MLNKQLLLPIKKIVRESPKVKTFYFHYHFNSLPGQFMMVWVPGIGERPMAIFENKNGFLMSVAKVGQVTTALHNMKVGERIGFRGPYGTHFSLPEKKGKIIMISRGCGIIPLIPLAIEAKNKGYEVIVLNGAETAKEVLYKKLFKRYITFICTQDGSLGEKMNLHELFAKYLSENKKPLMVYLSGSERMEYRIAKICWEKNIPFQASIERHLKCGVGVCGSCTVDPTGWRMCVEGPVIPGEKLKKIKEFGRYKRSASGKIEKILW